MVLFILLKLLPLDTCTVTVKILLIIVILISIRARLIFTRPEHVQYMGICSSLYWHDGCHRC